ncbi:MAG: hypothetical protein AAFP15_19125, partial [Bacteroidota bacterium]
AHRLVQVDLAVHVEAARAAEAVMRALFCRLAELGPQPGTPPGMQKLLQNETPSIGEFLDLDDHAFETALKRYSEGSDQVLAELAQRLRYRRLFKTMRLRLDVLPELARERLAEVLDEHHDGPDYVASVDRVEIAAYIEDDRMMVHTGGRLQRLLDVSPVLHGLSNETFVHYRLVFPPELRDTVRTAFADLR